MGPTRAHALFQAGMRTPSEVFAADESKLKEALAKALARGMQRRSAGKPAAGGTMEAMQVRPRQLSCRLALPMQRGFKKKKKKKKKRPSLTSTFACDMYRRSACEGRYFNILFMKFPVCSVVFGNRPTLRNECFLRADWLRR